MVARGEREEGSAAYKSLIKLPPAIGDWTTYKPSRAPTKKVRLGLYSFDRLSQEELKCGHIVHYNFGRLFVKELKSKLNISGELHTVSCEQTSYANFVKQILQPVVHISLSIPKISENIHVLIDLNLANTLINHSLGSMDTTAITRSLTEIEERTLSMVLTELMDKYVHAFEGIFEAPNLNVISSPDMTLDGSVAPTSTFVFFTLEVSLADSPAGKILIGYTAETLKTLLKKYENVIQSKSIDFTKLPGAILDNIRVPVTGYLGETNIPTQELKTLELGDVVALDSTLEDLLPIILGTNVKLTGRAGIKDGKLSMRFLGFIAREIPHEKVEKIEGEGEELEYPIEKEEKEEYPIEEEEAEEELEEEEEKYPIEEEEEEAEEEFEEEEFPEEKGEM